jgi:hypothetical protein
MRMTRSLIYAGLALAAMAFTIASPAVAAVPTDPGIYQPIPASLDAPVILQVHDDHVALTREAPSAIMSAAAGRSSFTLPSLNVASTPATVAAYLHIDPGIRG